MPQLTAHALTLATMARQHLLERSDFSVERVVADVVAVQAQHPPAVHLAIWNRLETVTTSQVAEAFRQGRLVRANLLRVTIHAARVEDHPWLLAAMTPTLRSARLDDRRYREAGLSPSDADEAVEDVIRLLRTPRSPREVREHLAARSPDPDRLWWALRHIAPITRAPTDGPWGFHGTDRYVATDTAPPDPSDMDAANEALARLVDRYLRAFGPASIADIAQFALVPRSRVRQALAARQSDLRNLTGPEGQTLLDVADGVLPDEGAEPPPRLLGMWDNLLFAYHDRTRVIDDAVRSLVIRRNGDCLPTVLVGGRVVGVWRIVDGLVEITCFAEQDERTWRALEQEAAALLTFLGDNDPPFARYHRWWTRLPQVPNQRRLGR
ncbi:winged helix DNA-binding domain-containing protein [Euzebya tangerina]|uniref:winged helix DNA-binding domain-containing protein n=1 Tax=Euzebya tangerina TaxID=591198 RepID=UPI000E30FA39|nr:winged helix DNA-binding domain-containing protein [Euzebya tangerina]